MAAERAWATNKHALTLSDPNSLSSLARSPPCTCSYIDAVPVGGAGIGSFSRFHANVEFQTTNHFRFILFRFILSERNGRIRRNGIPRNSDSGKPGKVSFKVAFSSAPPREADVRRRSEASDAVVSCMHARQAPHAPGCACLEWRRYSTARSPVCICAERVRSSPVERLFPSHGREQTEYASAHCCMQVARP